MYQCGRVRHHPMSTLLRTPVRLLLTMAVLLPTAATAQEAAVWDDQVPAHAAVVDGTSTLERDGLVDPLALNTILVAGDRIRTDQGRVEVIFSDGSVLDVDAFSSIDLLSDTLIRLLEGRVRLTVARTSGADYRVDSAGGSVVVRMAGEYRISTGNVRSANPQLELVVYRGSAELRNQLGTTIVRPGTYAVASAATTPSLPYAVNSAAWDEFDVWANGQRDARLGYTSTPYLPVELRSYGGALDHAGNWDYVAPYGNVWYPYVPAGWYPYSQGSWSFVGHFGWTWVGVERWAWPTHHYGRGGHHGGRWFWIPGRHWSPAWVSWVASPVYVGWSPLGFDNRPIVSITTVVNIGPRLGWSVVPRSHWKRNVYVPGVVVPHRNVRPEVWGQFAVRRDAPGYDGGRGDRAMPAPLPAPPNAGRAVPRASARSAVTPAAPRSAPPPRATAPLPARSVAAPRAATSSTRPTVRPATAPTVRSAPSSARPATADVRSRGTASTRPRQPATSATTAGNPRSDRPAVTYYRGGPTAASSPSRSTNGRVSARPPAGASVASPAPVMRSAPTAPPSRSASPARPRAGVPSAPANVGRPSSAAARVAPPRAGTAPPSAQPSRAGGRPAPSGAPSRGQARPRGGGGGGR